jgi:hypothetical protein
MIYYIRSLTKILFFSQYPFHVFILIIGKLVDFLLKKILKEAAKRCLFNFII